MSNDMEDIVRSRERTRRERPSRFSEVSRDRSADRGSRGDRGCLKSSNNRVYVSNIPYEFRWQDMKDLFRSQIGDVQFVELFVDDNDKPKGCGIVEFSDSSSVKKCLEIMQRYEVKGRKLIVREEFGNIRDKHGSLIGGGVSSNNKRSRDDRLREDRDRYDSHHGSGVGNSSGIGGSSIQLHHDDNKWGNTYGLSPNFLESLNIDAPLSNRVFVANLEYNIDKKKLEEVFRLAGKVFRVEIPLDKDGRSRGFAVIEYDHPVEAVQAISMLHNQFLYDRPMTVRMDRANDSFKLPEGLKSVGMGLGSNGEPLRNVAHNLPSLNFSSNNQSTGVGLLGAVPNSALQVATALSGLNHVVGGQFSSLSNLAGNILGGDLSLASSLVQNPNYSSMTANSNAPSITPATLQIGNNPSNMSSFGRLADTSVYSSAQLSNFSGNQGTFNSNNNSSNSTRNYSSSYDIHKPTSGYNFNNDNSGFSTTANTSLIRSPSQNDSIKSGSKSFSSRKVLISKLPPSINYKIVYEKVNELGDVKHMEEKDRDGMIITYASEWQAERACQNLDHSYFEGRFIEARMYYG